MADTTFGQGGKTGTVYGGPAPSGGTVYSGPAAGNVYKGPIGSTAAPSPAVEPAIASGGSGAAKGANIFFLIAAFTGINTILMFVGVRFAVGLGAAELAGPSLESFVVANIAAACVFALLGVFAKKGSKAAFVTGALLYGGDLVLLALSNPASHVISIVIHGLFLFYLLNAFRQLD